MQRNGFTLIELLVAISIITILVSLSLPAVQSARESARTASCANKPRQCGLGLQSFEATHRQYPSNGWGWAWVGDASFSGRGQLDGAGSWIHNVLPFVEQQSLWELTKTEHGRSQAIQTPIAMFVCPSRRDGKAYPYTQTTLPLRNATTPNVGSRSDYAICAGDRLVSVGPGPLSLAEIGDFPVPSKRIFSGISFIRSRISSRDLFDGTSHTIAVAEKLVPVAHYETGVSLGDDQTMLIGDDVDVRRWTHFLPLPDRKQIDDIERFGAAHFSGVNAVFCDGSVHLITYEVDNEVWRAMGNRADGLQVTYPF